MVSLVEVSFYIGALFGGDAASFSLDLISAVQHLYFIVAPALFLPLGTVILGSRVLLKALGYAALLLGTGFIVLGAAFLYSHSSFLRHPFGGL
jgi:hypothetical protein